MRYLLALLIFAALGTGCSESPTGPGAPSLTGEWRGETSRYLIRLTLTESGSSVTGGGVFSGVSGSAPVALTITGTRSSANSATLTAGTEQSGSFTIAVTAIDADQLNASLNGGGLEELAVQFVRQETR